MFHRNPFVVKLLIAQTKYTTNYFYDWTFIELEQDVSHFLIKKRHKWSVKVNLVPRVFSLAWGRPQAREKTLGTRLC